MSNVVCEHCNEPLTAEEADLEFRATMHELGIDPEPVLCAACFDADAADYQSQARAAA